MTCRCAPATGRNREPILAALRDCLPAAGTVVEIAAGSGEHALFFAAAFADLAWQPTDQDQAALDSIEAWRATADVANLRPALRLDASRPATWPLDRAEAVVCINMIHISPWAATQGLMAGAGRILPAKGVLFCYGPFVEADRPTAPSNLVFDADLRARNPAWGIRRVTDVAALADRSGFDLQTVVPMPANNLSLVFRKR